MFLNIGTPKIFNFPFWTNGKLVVLGVPKLKHFRVYLKPWQCFFPLPIQGSQDQSPLHRSLDETLNQGPVFV